MRCNEMRPTRADRIMNIENSIAAIGNTDIIDSVLSKYGVLIWRSYQLIRFQTSEISCMPSKLTLDIMWPLNSLPQNGLTGSICGCGAENRAALSVKNSQSRWNNWTPCIGPNQPQLAANLAMANFWPSWIEVLAAIFVVHGAEVWGEPKINFRQLVGDLRRGWMLRSVAIGLTILRRPPIIVS